MPDAAAEQDESPLTILLWSLFLGMSWTWCIGMFLPVILVREFGFAGWIVFAVPNVVGAAAMGWVLRTRASSVRITENHPVACVAFTWVTVAFHLFFIQWLVIGRLFPGWWSVSLFVVILWTYVLVSWKRPHHDVLSAAATFLVSVLVIGAAVSIADRHDAVLPIAASRWSDASILLTVCVFGFALCPYLDLTFHRVRQNTSRRGARVAFSLGFGLFFLLMIVFTLWYAPLLAKAVAGSDVWPKSLSRLLAFHMLVQSALTSVLHVRHLFSIGVPRMRSISAVVFPCLILGLFVQMPRTWLSLDAGEFIYRCFMGFYALLFPAYVYLCIIPGRGASPPTKRHLLVFASSVLIALPMFWIGFIHQRLIWLLPGLLVVLLARLALPSKRATI